MRHTSVEVAHARENPESVRAAVEQRQSRRRGWPSSSVRVSAFRRMLGCSEEQNSEGTAAAGLKWDSHMAAENHGPATSWNEEWGEEQSTDSYLCERPCTSSSLSRLGICQFEAVGKSQRLKREAVWLLEWAESPVWLGFERRVSDAWSVPVGRAHSYAEGLGLLGSLWGP